MKIGDYGISCTLAIRGPNGVDQIGPFSSLDEIPIECYSNMIWVSIMDHCEKEIIYIRAKDSADTYRVQIIFDYVVDYTYRNPLDFSKSILIDLLDKIINNHEFQLASYMDRLKSIKHRLITQ